ncbi:MAG TPA: hypothetical protein VHF22_11435, partial [Planctomycetota bacterium]|nr:hypothetical protein [Planctomycetota bacterium]
MTSLARALRSLLRRRLVRGLLLAVAVLATALAATVAAVFHDPGGGERADGEVNVFIGTDGAGFQYGATFPGACVPYGLARPGPETTSGLIATPFHHFSGYHYADGAIRGFSQTRMSGVGCSEFGN